MILPEMFVKQLIQSIIRDHEVEIQVEYFPESNSVGVQLKLDRFSTAHLYVLDSCTKDFTGIMDLYLELLNKKSNDKHRLAANKCIDKKIISQLKDLVGKL